MVAVVLVVIVLVDGLTSRVRFRKIVKFPNSNFKTSFLCIRKGNPLFT